MIHGYKATGIDLKCKDHQYHAGGQHFYNDKIELGKSGFHYSRNLTDTFRYYLFNGQNRYFHCIAGRSIHGDYKSVTDDLTITEEILGPELYNIAIEHDPNNIQYIFPQTEELCLKAVQLDGLAIKYVKHKTPAVITAAIKQNPLSQSYC